MTVGDRIRQTRIEKGMTQQQLSEAIGVSKQAIFKYETNIVTNIPTDRVNAIAKCLGVKPAYLMGWDTPEKKEKATSNEEDGLNAEIIKIFNDLPADQKNEALNYLRYLATRSKNP